MDIYSVVSPQFWFFVIFFIVSIYFSFYIPGAIITSYYKQSPKLIIFVLSNVLGLVMWGIQGYIFGYLNIRFLSFAYIIFFAYLAYRKGIVTPAIDGAKIKKLFITHKLFTCLIFLGVIVQSIPVFGSGLLYPDGIRFIGVNAYDGVMHLSYIQSIVRHFPPIEPGAFNNEITNYHYWTDLVLADLARIWKVPISHLFFQYFPVYVSILTGLSAIALVKIWGGTKHMAAWFLFLLYFAGDAAYLFMLVLHNTFGFYTPAIDNGPTQFLNMPHAVAKPIFLTGLLLFHIYLGKRNLIVGITMVVVFAALFGFKVYFGIYIAIGLLCYGAFAVITKFLNSARKKGIVQGSILSLKNNAKLICSLSIFGVIALTIYLPPNSDSGGLFYAPLEWPKLFLNHDNLNINEWWLRHQVYEAHGNIRNIIILDTIAVIITIFCVYGTRVLGFFPNRKLFQFLGIEKIFLLLPGLFLFQILGLFTLQESGGFNVFNFFAVSAVILSLFSAFFLGHISDSKKIIARVFVCAFILFSIPRSLYEVAVYFNQERLKDSTNVVRLSEVQAFAAIRKKTPADSLIQSHPANPYDSRSPYVAFFSDRYTYLSGVGIQETHNQPIGQRKKMLQLVFEQVSEDDFVNKLESLGIRYIYLQKVAEQKLSFPLSERFFDIIYDDTYIRVIGLKEK